MTSFLSLPYELLVAIFKDLPRSDLRALSTVSPYFRHVAQSCLYAKVELWWDDKYTPRILSLLLALVRRPELALHVRELVLDGNRDFYFEFRATDHYDDLIVPPKLSLDKIPAAEIQALQRVSPTFTSLSDKQRWAEGVQQGSMDALVTLLISLLPQLQSIQILNSFAKEVSILGSFLRSALLTGTEENRFSSALSQVQNITYSPREEYNGAGFPYDPADILPLFYLPRLREMSAWLTNPAHFSWPSTRAPDATSLVKLHLSRVREHNLEPILRQTTRLESFHWTWSWDYYGGSTLRSNVIDLEKFFHALSHVRGTLRELTMRAQLVPYRNNKDFIDSFTIHGSMRPLKEYKNLCSVGANPGFFLGIHPEDEAPSIPEVLPPGVERVTFYADFGLCYSDPWDFTDIVEEVNTWLAESLQDTPVIRDVHVHGADKLEVHSWEQAHLDESDGICRGFEIGFQEVSTVLTYKRRKATEQNTKKNR